MLLSPFYPERLNNGLKSTAVNLASESLSVYFFSAITYYLWVLGEAQGPPNFIFLIYERVVIPITHGIFIKIKWLL